MKYIKLFEQFINEKEFFNAVLKKAPDSYADSKFWDSKFKGGITEPEVDKPKYKNILHSIAYDLKLPVFNHRGEVSGLTYYGRHITNSDGTKKIVKDAFVGDFTYDEIKDEIEKWAKKTKLI